MRARVGLSFSLWSLDRRDEATGHLRELLRLKSGRFGFDEAVEGADRVTVAVTLFALLELYKRGEASWEQGEPFGPITVQAS
jgi:segregation and condensation protein A